MAGQVIKPPVLAQPGALGVRNRQVSSGDWFGPLEPLRPTAPAGTQIRQFEYLPGQNLIYQPRANEPISFSDLIFMADNCDIVRIIIEALKDEVCLKQWQVRVKAQPGETEAARAVRQKDNLKVQYWTQFLSWPNPDYCWADFLRMVLEDLFVTDAPTILLQRTRRGAIGALRAIDGQTIHRVIDDFGFTPQPPRRAYQQILYGMPAVDLTADDIVYRPHNVRARKLYGQSPCEQILMTLNIVMRRQKFVYSYYSEGNVPEALYTMPGNVTEDNVRKFQTWFDQSLAGNLAARRRIWFIPGDDKGVQRLHFTKTDALKDDADEWFARLVCYAFRMSPMEFIKMMNRATAVQSQSSSDEQGVQSVCAWVVDTINYIIQRKAGDADIEFTFQQKRESDILKQAQTDLLYINGGVNTRNEIRENKGEDPSQDPEADVLGVTTAAGFVPLGQQAITNANTQAAQMKALAAGPQPDEGEHSTAATPPEAGNTASASEAPAAKALQLLAGVAGLRKKKRLTIETHEEAIAQHNVDALHTAVRDFLHTAGTLSAERVTKLLAGRDIVKSGFVLELMSLNKADDETKKPPTAEEVIDVAADITWADLVAPAEAALFGAATTGADIAIGQLEITDGDLISSVSPLARDFAHARAAELVGMQYRGGKLVQNPNAAWRIDETTRNQIRTLVEKAFGEETKVEDLAEQIRTAGAFSASRAMSIARTEIARAQSLGTLDVWKKLGNVKTTEWTVSADGPCDECRENSEADPVPLGEPYPSGDIAPPAHVNCRCSLTAVDIQ
jgi:portal protein/F like protein